MTIEPFNVEDNVAAGATETPEFEMKEDGRFSGFDDPLRISFPIGPQANLRITVEIIDLNGIARKSLVNQVGNNYVTGDNVVHKFPTDAKIKLGEIIRVTTVNADAVNAHDYNVTWSIIYGA